MSEQSNPQRTCIGCKCRDDQGHLLRLAITSVDGVSAVVVDEHRRFPGRGAWMHPRRGCMALAVKRRAFNRAFKVPADSQTAERYFQAIDPAPQGASSLPTVHIESGSEN